MRVGFVTHLLWDRYGPFWVRLLEAVGAEPAFAEEDAVRRAWSEERVARAPSLAARGAAAQAWTLADCERIVVPDLNPDFEGTRGSAQDPFVASLPDALAQTLVGLPLLIGVPAALRGDGLEGLALQTMLSVSRDPGLARRAWRTHRAEAKPGRVAVPPTAKPPEGAVTVGLVGQPWLLGDGLQAELTGAGEHVTSAHRLDPEELRQEGWRLEAAWAPTDAEAVGAARRFARQGSVDRVRLLVDRTSVADLWLERRVREVVRKPLEVVALQDDADLLRWVLPAGAGPARNATS